MKAHLDALRTLARAAQVTVEVYSADEYIIFHGGAVAPEIVDASDVAKLLVKYAEE